MSTIQSYGSEGNLPVDYGTQTQEITSPRGPTYSDSVSSLGGLHINYNYTQGSNNPALIPPNPNASEQARQQEAAIPQSPGFESAYYNAFAEYLEDLAGRYGLTEDQVSHILFAHLTNTVPDDTFLQDVLAELESHVAGELAEVFGEDVFPEVRNQARALREGGGSAVNSSRAQLQQLQDYVDSLPAGPEKERLQQFINEARSQLDNVEQTLSQLENVSSREQLESALQQLNRQTEGLRQHLVGIGDITTDPAVGTVIAHVSGEISAGFASFSDSISTVNYLNDLASGNLNGLQEVVGSDYSAVIETAFNAAFDQALERYAQENGLSPEQTAQLRFAHFNPGAVTDASIQEALGVINQQAAGVVAETLGIPPGYVPNVNNVRYNAQIEQAYDDAFLESLGGYDLSAIAGQLGISEEEAAGALRYLHFHPDAEFPGSETLRSVVSELQSTALSHVRAVYGVPEGYEVNPSTFNFDAQITGSFLHQFDYNLRNSEPPLSQEQIQNVRAALGDPLNPNVTNETKSLIQRIYEQTVAEIRAENNLPVAWIGPPVIALNTLANVPSNIRVAWGGIEYVQTSLQVMAQYVDSMADNPAKALIINVMKIVSQALATLKTAIAQLQVADSQIATLLARIQQEAVEEKVRLQMEKLDEVRKKQAKLKPLQKFMKVFGPMSKVMGALFIVALAVALGPVGLLLAAAYFTFVIMEVKGQESPMTTLFNKIMESVPSPQNIAASAAIMVGLGVAATMIGGAGGTFMALEWFFSSSGIVQAIVAEMGFGEMTQEITNAVVQGLVELTILVVLTIFTAGAGASLLIASITAKVAQAAAKALKIIADALSKVLERVTGILKRILETIIKALQRVADAFIKWAEKIMKQIKAATEATQRVQGLQKLQKAGQEFTDTGQEVATELAQAIQTQQRIAQSISHTSNAALGVVGTVGVGTGGVLQGTASIIQGTISIIQGQLAEIIAEIEAQVEVLENLIKILRKVLDSLFQGIEANGEWLVEIGNLQTKIWADLSQTASIVAGANDTTPA